MTPEGLRKKIERETGLFLRLQTHKFKDSGPFSDWVYEGYLTVSTEQQILKGINGHKDRKRPAGISKDFSVHDHPSADEARLDVLAERCEEGAMSQCTRAAVSSEAHLAAVLVLLEEIHHDLLHLQGECGNVGMWGVRCGVT